MRSYLGISLIAVFPKNIFSRNAIRPTQVMHLTAVRMDAAVAELIRWESAYVAAKSNL